MIKTNIEYVQVIRNPIQHEMNLIHYNNKTYGKGDKKLYLKCNSGIEFYFYGDTYEEAEINKNKFISLCEEHHIDPFTEYLLPEFDDFIKSKEIFYMQPLENELWNTNFK